MSEFIVRIIGGAIGGYISGKIYHHFYKNKNTTTNPPLQPPKENKHNINDVSSFDDILNIQIQKSQQNHDVTCNDNLEQINKTDILFDKPERPEREQLYINDAIYDNTYFDFYGTIGR